MWRARGPCQLPRNPIIGRDPRLVEGFVFISALAALGVVPGRLAAWVQPNAVRPPRPVIWASSAALPAMVAAVVGHSAPLCCGLWPDEVALFTILWLSIRPSVQTSMA